MEMMDDTLLNAFRLSEEGEVLYKKVWATDVEYLSEHVGIRKIYDEKDGRINLAVVVDSQTDKKDIPAVWKKIEEHLSVIVKAQGDDLNDYLQVAIQALEEGNYVKIVEDETAPPESPLRHKLITTRPQYRDIMMDANFDILVFAIRASKIGQDFDKAKTPEEVYKAEQDASKVKIAKHFLYNLCRMYGGRNKKNIDPDIDTWLQAALVDIADGRCPHDIYDGPITYDKLSDKFQDLKERYRPNINSKQSKENLLKVYHHFVLWGDWKDATELLKKTFPKTYKLYKPRLDGRLYEIFHSNAPLDAKKPFVVE